MDMTTIGWLVSVEMTNLTLIIPTNGHSITDILPSHRRALISPIMRL